MSTLASRIKQARKQAGLTQKDLSQRVGVSQPVISQLENGENLQSVHLLAIAKACGVDSEWLASGEEGSERVVLTKEQLADLLRESFKLGAESAEGREYWWISTEVFHDARERAIQPLVHRSSGGYDDHGREVMREALSRLLALHCPLTGSPTAQAIEEHWLHEKQQGNGSADDYLFALSAMRACQEDGQ